MSEVVKLVLKEVVARPGKKFSCVVLLDPHDERVTRAAGLTVRLEWRAWRADRGSPSIYERQTVATWSQELPLRMEYTVALELPARAPVTYRGSIVLIDWVVIAELDVPLKKDPAVTQSLRVLPRGAALDSTNVRWWQVPNPRGK